MQLVASAGGRIVVRHADGYVFVFQVHDLDGLTLDLIDVEWPLIGPPPDADELEMDARRFAQQEARTQGWL